MLVYLFIYILLQIKQSNCDVEQPDAYNQDAKVKLYVLEDDAEHDPPIFGSSLYDPILDKFAGFEDANPVNWGGAPTTISSLYYSTPENKKTEQADHEPHDPHEPHTTVNTEPTEETEPAEVIDAGPEEPETEKPIPEDEPEKVKELARNADELDYEWRKNIKGNDVDDVARKR